MDFTKKRKDTEVDRAETPSADPGAESFLGKTVQIKGNISSEESVTLEGKLTGNITSKDSITLGKSGTVFGKLQSDFIDILGNAKGTIIAGKKLKLLRDSKFEGDITSTNVIIEEGGIFNGNMNMAEKKGG